MKHLLFTLSTELKDQVADIEEKTPYLRKIFYLVQLCISWYL
jgi:hypothetical protein